MDRMAEHTALVKHAELLQVHERRCVVRSPKPRGARSWRQVKGPVAVVVARQFESGAEQLVRALLEAEHIRPNADASARRQAHGLLDALNRLRGRRGEGGRLARAIPRPGAN